MCFLLNYPDFLRTNGTIPVFHFVHYDMKNKVIWGQFHQFSTHSFYVCKLREQLFCAYVLGLYFTAARLLAQKLHVEC